MSFLNKLSLNNRLIRLTLVTILTGLAILRVQDVVIRPQFWAEDGSIFFHDSNCFGFQSLRRTYAGYYHLVPRLISLFAGLFNPLYAPILYSSLAIISMALVLYLVLSPRLPLPYKPFLAFFIVAIPNADLELYANITNVQWHIAIGVFAVVLMKPSASRIIIFLERVFIFIAGLTGPFVLLLMPVFVLKTVWVASARQDKLRMMGLIVIAVVTAFIQAFALSVYGLHMRGSITSSTSGLGEKFLLILDSIFLHIFSLYGLGIGHLAPTAFTNISFQAMTILSSILLIITAIIVMYSFFKGNYKFEKAAIYYFGMIVLIAGLYKSRNNLFTLLNNQSENRYFFIPNIMLCWLFMLMLKEKLLKFVAAVLIVLLLFSTAVDFIREPLVDYNWPFWANKIHTTPNLQIPINPPGWVIDMSCHTNSSDSI